MSGPSAAAIAAAEAHMRELVPILRALDVPAALAKWQRDNPGRALPPGPMTAEETALAGMRKARVLLGLMTAEERETSRAWLRANGHDVPAAPSPARG